MKLLALLCFIGLAAASSPNWQWQIGKDHIFYYTSRLLTGIPGLRPHFSGIGIESEVHIQVKSTDDIRLSLRRVNFTEVNGPLSSGLPHVTSHYEGSNWRHVLLPNFTPAPTEIKTLLRIPITFSVRDGEIKTITVSGAEQEWSLNFKKALVVLFQNKMERSSLDLEMNTISKESYETKNYWKVSEETIEGVCDVTYQINELPEYIVKERMVYFPRLEMCTTPKYYEITKTKEIDSCKKSALYTFFKPAMTSGSCNSFKCMSDAFGSASSTTRYYACGSRSNLMLQTIVNEGEVVHRPTMTKSEPFVTGTRQVMKLYNIKTINEEIPKTPQPRTTESVMYEYVAQGEILRGQIGYTPKISQSELKNAHIYKYLPRHFLPNPTSQETKDRLSSQNIMHELKKYIIEIINDLTEVEDLAQKEIPLRLTSVIRGLTLLKYEEITNLYQDLKTNVYTPEKTSSLEKRTMFYNIFFDSVMVSGTTPAVIFLKEMIRSEEITPFQATYILTLLPHHVITPSKEVFTSLFELIRSEVVTKRRPLFNSAVLAMSNLVQKTCIDKSRYISYPTSVFGQFCDPHSEIVIEKWIPFLAHELKTARTSDKRNVIIMALGILGHKDVVPILLPLIEGTGPVRRPEGVPRTEHSFRNVSRFLSIYALSTAGVAHPEIVVPITFSIYSNPAENTEIRISAFNILMRMNPSMHYFQQIASSTWSEKDMEVLRSVYTSIYTLSQNEQILSTEVTNNEGSLVKKAQIILPLMRKVNGILTSSGTYYDSSYMPLLDAGFKSVFSWTSNYKTMIPSDIYYQIRYILGDYKIKPFEMAFKLHGGSNLMRNMFDIKWLSGEERKSYEEMYKKYGHLSHEQLVEKLKTLSPEEKQKILSQRGLGGRYATQSRRQAILEQHQAMADSHLEGQFKAPTLTGSDETITPSSHWGPNSNILDEHLETIKGQLHREWVKVIKQLKMETREDGPLTTLVYFNLFDDSSYFMSISDITTEVIREKIAPYMLKVQKKGWINSLFTLKTTVCERKIPLNFQRVINNQNVEFLIPSDMGFPIIFEKNMPSIVSVRGHMEVVCDIQAPTIKFDTISMAATHFSTNVGTFSPFTKKAIVTGLKQDLALNIPAKTQFTFKVPTNELKVFIKPVEISKAVDLIYFTNRPYTSAISYYSFLPKCHSEEMKLIKSNSPLKTVTLPRGCPIFGTSIVGKIETEAPYMDYPYAAKLYKLYKNNPLNMYLFFFAPHTVTQSGLPSIRRHTFKLQYDPSGSSVKEIEFTISLGFGLKRYEQEPNYYSVGIKTFDEMKNEPFYLKSWMPYTCVPRPISEQVHPTRQRIIQNILTEKLNLVRGYAGVLRFEAKFHGGLRPGVYTYQLNIGAGRDANFKSRWHFSLETEPSSPTMTQKICVDGHAFVPFVPTWDIDMIRSTDLDFQMKNVIGFGRTCNESSIRTFTNFKVTDKQIRMSKESPVATECQELIEKRIPGALTSPACEETRQLAKMYDEINIKMEYINTPPTIKNTAIKLVSYMQSLFWPYKTETRSFIPSSNSFEEHRESLVRIMFDKSSETVDLVVKTPERHLTFKRIQVPSFLRPFFPTVPGEYNLRRGFQTLTGNRMIPTCRIEKNWLRTYDNRSLPLKMDDCYHLITGDCSASYTFGVLARSMPHTQSKELKIFLNKTEIIFVPKSSYSENLHRLKIMVNGTEEHLEKNTRRVFREETHNAVVFEIFRSTDDVLQVKAPYYGLSLQFNGERLSIETSTSFKNKLCGICGDLNHQRIADLRGPQKCIYSRPEVEIAAYRISSPHCSALEGSIKEKLETETRHCAKYEEIPTEVYKTFISLAGKCTRHQHMMLERGNEICFSIIPVTQCGAQCSPKPRQLVSKNVGFHCMKTGRLGELYREKVIQGQILPELKTRVETFATAILVPQSCVSVTSGYPMVTNSGIPSTVPSGSEFLSRNTVNGGMVVTGVEGETTVINPHTGIPETVQTGRGIINPMTGELEHGHHHRGGLLNSEMPKTHRRY